MKTIDERLANDFNRKAFTKEIGRLPYNDHELIGWVLELMEGSLDNKKSLSHGNGKG